METPEGLNELIKNRLINKKGNVKLSENNDIVLYGQALGISENQLLFKILDISETINWAENNKSADCSTSVQSNDSIICKNCNANNDKNNANFCEECGTELKEESIFINNSNIVNQKKNNKTNILYGVVIVIVFFALGSFYYFKNIDNNQLPIENIYNEVVDSTERKEKTINNNSDSITSVANEENFKSIQALNILTEYYYDINNSNFNAENYFSDNVLQFITRKNLTPDEINLIFSQNTEYLNGKATIFNNELKFERIENNLYYYSYWVDYNCFRKSKNKNQYCKVKVEVGFENTGKLTSYKELQIKDLRFEEI